MHVDMRAGDLGQYDAIILPNHPGAEILLGNLPGMMPEGYVGGVGAEGTAQRLEDRDAFDWLNENGIDRYKDQLDLRVCDSNRFDVMAACDAVVAASGTVILELAILGVPTVATYRLSPKTYFLGQLLAKVKYFTLVNLIGARTIIPELLQDQVNPVTIARELELIIEHGDERKKIIDGLAEVRQKLGAPGASKRAAEIALEIIGQNEQ